MRSAIRFVSCCALAILLDGAAARADLITVTFEGLGGISGLNQTNNQTDPGFSQGGAFFNNSYTSSFGGIWSGWSLSSKVDNVPVVPPALDYLHQYGAYTPINAAGGTGATGSITYAVANNFSTGDAYINLPAGLSAVSLDLANSVYTASAILHGDAFARAFDDGDFFRIDIFGFAGLGATGSQTGSTSFYLADYRDGKSFVLDNWATIDLGGLGDAKSIGFNLVTTDIGQFGPNTPLYFVADNLVLSSVPEPASLVMLGMGLLAAAGMARGRHRARNAA